MSIRDTIENKILTRILSIPVSQQSQARFLFVVAWLLPIYILRWLLGILFMGEFSFSKRPLNPQTRTLTFSVQGEGFGGQFARYVTALQVAEILNITFVHHPFERNFHCPEIDWDRFVGFAELHPNSLSTDNPVRVVNLPNFDLTNNRNLQLLLLKLITGTVHRKDYVHFVLHPWAWAPPEATPNFAVSLFSTLRAKYQAKRLADPLPVFNERRKIRVTVVVRRGEIAQWRELGDRPATWRWVEIDWYLAVLQRLYTKLGKGNIECHIFSDVSDRSQLDPLLMFPDIKLHTKNEPLQPLLLFNAMVESDITVCGLTLICYAAGVLGKGVMIVPPNKAQAVYFPNGERWIEVDEQANAGKHDNRLNKALKALTVQKGLTTL